MFYDVFIQTDAVLVLAFGRSDISVCVHACMHACVYIWLKSIG